MENLKGSPWEKADLTTILQIVTHNYIFLNEFNYIFYI